MHYQEIQEIRSQLQLARWGVSSFVFTCFVFFLLSNYQSDGAKVSEQDNRTKYTPPTAAIASVGPKIRKYATNEKK